jgi:hypothetical protein
MFGRGTWAVLGLAKESLEAFRVSLEDRALMVASSQLASSAAIRFVQAETVGVNPYGTPRLDEEHPVAAAEHDEQLAQFALAVPEERALDSLPAEVVDGGGYGFSAEQFQLHPTMPWFGLWAVSNELKDVGDLPTIKEQRSYVLLDRPYKFLQALDKHTVDEGTPGVTAAVRKQVPVLLDFNDGRVYIENSNKKLIERVIDRLSHMGAAIVPVAWTYQRSNWPAAILNKLYEDTQFGPDFKSRADEATRFSPKEIEKLEDKEMESIVSNYFSMTLLPSDLWVGISVPTQIRLHDAGPPVAAKPATTATQLLNMTGTAKLLSGVLTYQERVSAATKSGGEYTFRKDLFRFQLNDKMNFTEVGAAMLRGFDVPGFKKNIQREIRNTGQVPPIQQFWGAWLHEMSNAVRTIEGTFREILDIDGSDEAGIAPMRFPAGGEESAEAATA